MDSMDNFLNMASTNNLNGYTPNISGNFNSVNTTLPIPSESINNKNTSESNDEFVNKNKSELKDEFAKENKKNGSFEKFYNFVKNKTGLGLGSKKVEKKIAEFESGQATEEDVKNKISNYKDSQKNAEQHFGDFASAIVALPVYFAWTNAMKKINAKIEAESYGLLLTLVKKNTEFQQKEEVKELQKLAKEEETEETKGILKVIKNISKKIGKKMTLPEIKEFTGSKKAKLAILPLVMLLGGMTKWSVLKLNRIGSKEYKVENKKKLDKKELKAAKKELNHKRHKENFKNFCTGALNGLLMPITAVAGGIVGVPAYLLSTSGIRFLTNKNDNNDKKSFGNYIAGLKNNIALDSVFALALAAPLAIKAGHSAALSKNLEKVVKNLKGVELLEPDLPSAKTAYDEIEDLIFNSENIKNILSNTDNVDDAINKLTDENIFAVKFLQISNAGKAKDISSKLIENCPPTRSLEKAQDEVDRLIGSKNKYTLSKLLGVGTVAECYLAKDQSGKEVCVKILKNGIDAAKIERDKKAFINLVTSDTTKEQKDKEYLIKNIENMAEGLSKEVDFVNEMNAANKLRKSTTQADVVVPIEAKPGIYIMEKAPGISLDTLVKYYQNKLLIKCELPGSPQIAEYEKEIEKLKAKSPDFNDFDLSSDEIKMLVKKYDDIRIEQFTKVDKNGKTLHSDIHSGNIFINLEVLKNPLKKGKLFTLIDTGNTIDLTKEQAAASVRLTSYIKKGNVKDITKYVLNGAKLPQNMTQEEAAKLVEQDLKTIFFDKGIKIKPMDTDELFRLTNNIMRKYKITPNNTQLDLDKAKKAADKSIEELKQSFLLKNLESIMDEKRKSELIKNGLKMAKDFALMKPKYEMNKAAQETINLRQMSPKEIIKYLINPNNQKSYSEEYLTYQFKQDINRDFSKEFPEE